MTMFLKSATLNKEQKVLLRHALFLYQKEYYRKIGTLPEHKRELIDEVATALHLRDENHR